MAEGGGGVLDVSSRARWWRRRRRTCGGGRYRGTGELIMGGLEALGPAGWGIRSGGRWRWGDGKWVAGGVVVVVTEEEEECWGVLGLSRTWVGGHSSDMVGASAVGVGRRSGGLSSWQGI